MIMVRQLTRLDTDLYETEDAFGTGFGCADPIFALRSVFAFATGTLCCVLIGWRSFLHRGLTFLFIGMASTLLSKSRNGLHPGRYLVYEKHDATSLKSSGRTIIVRSIYY